MELQSYIFPQNPIQSQTLNRCSNIPIDLILFAYTLPQATHHSHSHLGKENGKDGGVHLARESRIVACKLFLLSVKLLKLLSRCLERRCTYTICRGLLVVMTANCAVAETPSLVSFSGTVLWPRYICGPERKMSGVEMKELAISSLEI